MPSRGGARGGGREKLRERGRLARLRPVPDDFRHDERTFDPAAEPGGVQVREVDQRYAALFGELLAEGPIDADGRAQLAMAAATLGIAPDRARRIEEALAVAAQA